MEIWKDIPNYESFYQASNLGRIKSLKRNKEKILKQSTQTRGYYRVQLSKYKDPKQYLVHKLVAMAFLNHTPDGYMLHIDHIDGNQLNNKVENLEELTAGEHRWKTIYTNPSWAKPKKPPRKTTSKYNGVSYYKKSKKWRAEITINGENHRLGYFKTEIEAYLETLIVKRLSKS
jgi:hypothetical protein